MTPFGLGRVMVILGTLGIPLCIWQMSQGRLLEETPYLGALFLLLFGVFLLLRYPRKPTK